MKYTSIKICLVFVALFGGVAAASDLPDCLKNGVFAGHNNCFGALTWANGKKYVGEQKNGKRNGQGIFTWPNGDKYVGEWRDNKRAEGAFTSLNGTKYVGEWKDQKPHGQGTYTWMVGTKYVGEFKDGNRSGQGTTVYGPASEWPGDRYVGDYKDNEMNGQGVYTYSLESEFAGDKYVGEYENSKRNGQGTYTHENGTVTVGVWKDGDISVLSEVKAIEAYLSGDFKTAIKEWTRFSCFSCKLLTLANLYLKALSYWDKCRIQPVHPNA